MSPGSQRIAIAEACGELNVRFTDSGLCIASIGEMEDGTFWGTHGVPDYLNDLNAMHEAEKIIFPKHENEWHYQLQKVCGCSWRIMIRATAAQRAEAFLKTLNLWKP
jgi:hypothetical protein